MDKLIVQGPAKLSGKVNISRSKNACLPILAAVLLSEKPVHLYDLPALRDIKTMIKLLEKLGVVVTKNKDVTIFDAKNITSLEATYELVKTMRASILVLGPLLARFKKAKVSLPGGCAIGTRPIDIHLSNLEKMGVKIDLQGGYVEATTKKVRGTSLTLSFPSVGATENLMMAAALTGEVTTIENVALEPEIDDLAEVLMKMGVKIEGIGTSKLIIHGLSSSSEIKEIKHRAIADRIETATYVMAGIITNSEIEVCECSPNHLDAVLVTLKDMGAKIETTSSSIKVFPSTLKGIKVDTAPYPGFPTDVQAQLIALATMANGASIVSENIFENRFMHVSELIRLGARIVLKGNSAIIEGGGELTGAPVMCTDLRASAALVLAALAANGETTIQRVYHLDRGYEKLEKKLRGLGVIIERRNDHDD